MEEKQIENNKVSEVQETVEEVKKPTGYYVAEVPTSFANVIALDGKQIAVEELIVKMANAIKDAGLFK